MSGIHSGVNIVLLEPEIPANTGNIGRTCVATGSPLHLIRPLGFQTDDKSIKRAGMDYWSQIDVHYYDDFEDFVEKNGHPVIYMTSSKVTRGYTDVLYPPGAFIMFGSEGSGIPVDILDKYPDTCVRIPMIPGVRCINLASSVALVVYEALRQQGFVGMV
ncbi:MAG: tRNA (cytidine(34)-2'-O)-methyltransferase [Defluviitaleaceae bacterium]|nr:tRNA (cytidine(34)-2'-O)-methyltransferase [Defluviitaleaceae bacterium]